MGHVEHGFKHRIEPQQTNSSETSVDPVALRLVFLNLGLRKHINISLPLNTGAAAPRRWQTDAAGGIAIALSRL